MTLRSERELANTRRKLRLLEEAYQETRNDPDEDEHIRDVTMESLRRLINQFKEEIARYEAHQPTRPQVNR
ncbi:MAG: hypothetical protein IIC51_03570 [Planctomycetes bacterium]|nr:hypothetical protein [Planctomycetota bacterium]